MLRNRAARAATLRLSGAREPIVMRLPLRYRMTAMKRMLKRVQKPFCGPSSFNQFAGSRFALAAPHHRELFSDFCASVNDSRAGALRSSLPPETLDCCPAPRHTDRAVANAETQQRCIALDASVLRSGGLCPAAF